MENFSILLSYFTNIRQRSLYFQNYFQAIFHKYFQNNEIFQILHVLCEEGFLLKSSIVVKGAVVVNIFYIFKMLL